MSSRDYIKHVVSSDTSINGQKIGDEVFDPVANKLYKILAVNGTTVTTVEIPLALTNSSGPTYTTTLTNSAIAGTFLSLPGNTSYIMTTSDGKTNMDVFLDGYKLVRGIDYVEANTTSIGIRLSIPIGSTIEYRIIR